MSHKFTGNLLRSENFEGFLLSRVFETQFRGVLTFLTDTAFLYQKRPFETYREVIFAESKRWFARRLFAAYFCEVLWERRGPPVVRRVVRLAVTFCYAFAPAEAAHRRPQVRAHRRPRL